MSAPTRDQLMANLVDMGFSESQAASYSQRYQSLEAALEALLRDEASGGSGADVSGVQPPPAQAQPPSASLTPPEDLEERKENSDVDYTSAVFVTWQPLRLASLSCDLASESDSDAEPAVTDTAVTASVEPAQAEQAVGDCEAIKGKPIAWLSGDGNSDDSADTFEVLHACGLPSSSQQQLLRDLSRTALLAAFKRMAAMGSGDKERSGSISMHDGTSATETADDLSTASPSFVSYRSHSACSSATSTPTLSACLLTPGVPSSFSVDGSVDDDDEEERECVVCLDAAKECLFLPCRHRAMCSGCTSSYFSRTREWNLLAAQVRADATTEAQQSAARGLSTSGSLSVRNKHADRANTCPSCSQTVALAIRRAPPEVSVAAVTVVDVGNGQQL